MTTMVSEIYAPLNEGLDSAPDSELVLAGASRAPETLGIEFGSFRLNVAGRQLLRDGLPVAIGSRSLDILIRLTQTAGSLVTKQQLIDYVWPKQTVEESCLRVHLSKLRKILGDGEGEARYIANVVGRGYTFVERVKQVILPPNFILSEGAFDEVGLQKPIICGREKEVLKIAQLLVERRFVTLHGPGGVGKTTAAVAAAMQAAPLLEAETCLLELGRRGPTESISAFVASRLAICLEEDEPVAALVNHFRSKRIVLILDCCEHLLHDAARFIEALVQECPHVAVLATSREPLCAKGEHVYRLSSMDGREVSADHRRMALEDENAKLKRLLAEAMLDNTELKDLVKGFGNVRGQPKHGLLPGRMASG